MKDGRGDMCDCLEEAQKGVISTTRRLKRQSQTRRVSDEYLRREVSRSAIEF